MLDPLTSLGLAANVVQLLDCAAQLTKESYNMIKSGASELPTNATIAKLAKSELEICEKIHASNFRAGPLNDDESDLLDWVDCYAKTATALIRTLGALEVKPGSDGSLSRRKQLSSVLKARLKQRDIDRLQKGHKRIQQGLAMALLSLMRCEELSHFDDIVKLLQRNHITNVERLLSSKTEVLHAIDRQTEMIESLRRDLSARHDRHDEAETAILREVIRTQELSEEKTTITAQQRRDIEKALRIRESLRFPQIEQRREDIAEAARQTFSWILSDATSDLRAWLGGGSGIFWVCGKPGAGKSTLIKYLTGEDETVRLLEDWTAGNSKLVTGEHYFWYPGTTMQKSHTGLYRSLIDSVLRQDGEDRLLIRTACPARWENAGHRAMKAWSRDELFQALVDLGSLDSVKICLFIDGLDEYNPHSDHDKLICNLRKLAALPSVKLCVSSRPWDVFEQALTKPQQMVVLEDMTRDDIVLHVWNELELAEGRADLGLDDFSSQSEAASNIVHLIADRSRGVFLWVHLILVSLGERIATGQNIETLRRYVDDFPPELETYFRELIYERISPTWREHSETACALKIAELMASGDDMCGDRSFLNYWLLREQDSFSDPDFARTRDCEQVSDKMLEKRLRATEKFLDASCKDLLKVTKRGLRDEGIGERYVRNFAVKNLVEFMHRTVYDFILTENMQVLINSRIPKHFHDATFRARIALARAKTIPSDEFSDDLCLYHGTALRNISMRLPPGPSDLQTEVKRVGIYYSDNFCGCQGRRQTGSPLKPGVDLKHVRTTGDMSTSWSISPISNSERASAGPKDRTARYSVVERRPRDH